MPRDDGFSPDPDELAPEPGAEPEDAEFAADDEDGDDEPLRGPFDRDEPEPDGVEDDAAPADASEEEPADEPDLEELKAKAALAEKWETYYRNQQQQAALRAAQERWAQQEREADGHYEALLAKVREDADNTPDPRAYRDFHERRIRAEQIAWHKRFENSKFAQREQAIARLQVPLYAEDVAVHWQIPRKYIPEMMSRAGGDPQKFNEAAEGIALWLERLDAKDAELDQMRKSAKARDIAERRVGPGQGRPSGGSKPGTRGHLLDLFDAASGR